MNSTTTEQKNEKSDELDNQKLCTGLELSQSSVVLDEKGGRIFLTATVLPKDCAETIFFSSNDEMIATVDSSGMITAIAPGKAEIIVTCGSKSEKCDVMCAFELPASKPYLSAEDFTLFSYGMQNTLKIENAPLGAIITYTSSDENVVTVSDGGIVTAVGSGTAIITVKVNDIELTCVARCNLPTSTTDDNLVVSGSYTISHADVILFAEDERFTITLFNLEGKEVIGEAWSSSDSSICSVDDNGRVTAIAEGDAIIYTDYGGKTYECQVCCDF